LDRQYLTQRDEVLGAWPNWFLGLAELYERDAGADAYLIVQDDVVFSRNVRRYLEQVLWPADRLGVVSLYEPWKNVSESGFVAVDVSKGLLGPYRLGPR
jgi:hypothetical protein